MKSCGSKYFNNLSFLFFSLFASLFIFEFILIIQPYLWFYLLILSFIGILGITWSLIHENGPWMYAIPSLIVILSLIINYIVRVTIQSSMASGPSSTLAILSDALYLSLPAAVTFLYIGFSVSGLKHAGGLAFLTGTLSIFTIPFIFQDLVKIQASLHGNPILSSDNIVVFLYMLVIMPIIGATLLWVGYSHYQKRRIIECSPLAFHSRL